MHVVGSSRHGHSSVLQCQCGWRKTKALVSRCRRWLWLAGGSESGQHETRQNHCACCCRQNDVPCQACRQKI